MGITWCRERLEQAQNSKSPVDRILIRCSNAMKPKTYSRSQDRLADDIVYRGIRKDLVTSSPANLQMPPPRSRPRLRGVADWQTCALTVPDGLHADEDFPSVAPIPPPRKKRKRKLNGELGSQEVLNQDGSATTTMTATTSPAAAEAKKENVEPASPKSIKSAREKTTISEQKKQSRFRKLSENRNGFPKARTELHVISTEEEHGKDDATRRSGRKKEHKMKIVKNVSTVSLPNYSELAKPTAKATQADSNLVLSGNEKSGATQTGDSKPPRRNQSTVSLPGEGSILSTLSEATISRIETYMKRCRSFGSLKPQQLLEKLEEFNKTNQAESESSDSWSGLDDWDLGIIEYCDPETANVPPVTPKYRLPVRSQSMPLFSLGTPQGTPRETPRRQSPVSEEEEDAEEEGSQPSILPKMVDAVPAENSVDISGMMESDNVPSDWFSENQSSSGKLDVERTKTPPPSPANGLADGILRPAPSSQSSLIEILTKYKDEELSDVASVRSEDATLGEEEPPRLSRIRSRSLIEANAGLLHAERFCKRSPSIGLEKTTRLLDELQEMEKELLANPEQVLNGLRRASLYENLPEDPFEMYMRQKKPSLRESLNVFLGFDPEKDGRNPTGDEDGDKDKEDGDTERKDDGEERPPPLPLNPPPIILSPPDVSSDVTRPLVTVTSDDGVTVKDTSRT